MFFLLTEKNIEERVCYRFYLTSINRDLFFITSTFKNSKLPETK